MQVDRGYGSNIAMRYLAFGILLAFQALWSSSVAAETNDDVVAALRSSLALQLLHAREWLEQKDYKSLAQSAGNVRTLAELQKSRSDDTMWQNAADNIVTATGLVQTASKTENAVVCQKALESLEKSTVTSMAISPQGKPQAMKNPPAIRPTMLLMDGILADGKVSLASGKVDGAKAQARVLSELAKLLTNARATPGWSNLAGDFSAAAVAAASSTESDSKAVRQLFRGISEKCEACHEKSRTQ